MNIYFYERIPIYGLMIILSIFIGLIYIYLSMKDEIKKDTRLAYFFALPLPFIMLFGFIFTMVVNGNFNIMENGLSSYGGVIGLILSALIFNTMLPNKNIVKYSVISLPLIYSISKIGCLFAGCCYGVHYHGIFNFSYGFEEVYNVLPIQGIETISFFIIFLILNKYKDSKNITEYTIISCALLKGSLDYLRMSHIGQILSANQIFSLILIFGTICYMIVRSKVRTKHEKR